MSELDPLVLSYSHLHHLPQPSSALHLLKKIASLVKPLMRARGWRVRELGEFYPEQENLLGLNINRGAKILLRLRYSSDKSLFLPVEQVTDTMLHELAHIVHGPHDGKFQALWDQLRDEHEGLVMKGYTGEGFLSAGRRLGGSPSGGRGRIPMHEARRLAREQAEKRKVQTTPNAGSGQRLGGSSPRPGEDIRRVIVEAVKRRSKTLKGCGVGVKDTGDEGLGEQEIRKIEEQATRNGFRSKAEEDEANEAAIAQALWELVQEDEKKKFGSGYVEPSREFPAGSQGAFQQTQEDLKGKGSAASSSSKQPPPNPHRTKPTTRPTVSSPPSPPSIPSEPPNEPSTDGWACRICTLHNPDTFLSCDACGTERPPRTLTTSRTSLPKDKTRGSSSSSSSKPSSNSKSSSSSSKRPSSSVIDLTKSPPAIRTRPSSSSHSSSSNSSKSHSRSRTASISGSQSESSSGSGPGFMQELKKDKEKREKDKAKAILQAQAEADAARRKLLTEKWQCSFCGKRMEKQWWTCSTCGRMKDSSK
ncbi:WLM domain-containing protein [Pseudoneurospora amorphoporcata]|uniref:WLM domain-containing protein n=1 Tax=Pseudoneurospora amorphoporcata TaxID=241081 RepID=A0AAN6NTI2_9PEZI|nr:WLM domain-containing protein [Pseudoneurospora amorphoporcata]